ncbi:hypothetical protein GJ496_010198 [Pomphorhynchus laevis]|nr:hypothetical protein GJ496_010198 [Pomphorhynchus laevis]
MMSQGSVFQKFSEFGVVCDSIPFDSVVSEKSQNCFISISCERHLVRRNTRTLKVSCKSDLLPLAGNITAHSSSTLWTYAASGSDEESTIYCFHKGKTLSHILSAGKVVSQQRGKSVNSSIKSLLILGNDLLLAGHDSGLLSLWQPHSQEHKQLVSSIDIGHPIKLMIHPATYVNKILLVLESSDNVGDYLVIWNIKTSSIVSKHELKDNVLTLVQSPAVDVFAIGMKNVEHAEQDTDIDDSLIGVSAISFQNERPFLLAGRCDGTIDVFDLEKQRHVYTYTDDQEFGRVTRICQVPGSLDLFCVAFLENAIVHYLIDKNTASLVKIREKLGNMGPVNMVRFVPESEKLYAVSNDKIVVWNSSVCQKRSNNVHAYRKYSDSILDICMAPRAASFFLKPEWADTVVLYRNCRFVSLARIDGRKDFIRKRHASNQYGVEKLSNIFSPAINGDNTRSPPIDITANVMCCDISYCSNFAVIGYTSGHIVVFNLQSREERLRIYVKEAVRAIKFDFLNRYILVGSDAGLLQTVPFRQASTNLKLLPSSLQLNAGIVRQFDVNYISELYAVPLANGCISLIKVLCRYNTMSIDLVRTMRPQQNNDNKSITCTKFSFDAVYRLNVLRLRTARSFHLISKMIFFSDNNSESNDHRFITACHDEPANTVWRSLYKVDKLIVENQPESAVEKPASAPFFLPSIPTLTGFRLVPAEDESDTTNSYRMEEQMTHNFIDQTELIDTLRLQSNYPLSLSTCNSAAAFKLMKRMSTFRLEYELDNLIRIISLDDEEDNQKIFESFLQIIAHQLDKMEDFDFTASVLCRLMVKSSTDLLTSGQSNKFYDQIENLMTKLQQTWKHLNCLVERSLCTIQFLKNDPI